MKITELLDKAKDKANLESDYALAKAVGITAGNMSNIRNGRAHPSNELAVQLATLAGMNEMQVIAEIEYQTAKNPAKKKFWKHYIESRGITAGLTLTVLALNMALASEPAESSILQLQNYGAEQSNFLPSEIYIMRN